MMVCLVLFFHTAITFFDLGLQKMLKLSLLLFSKDNTDNNDSMS